MSNRELDIVHNALLSGARLLISVSGGKDSQAMTNYLNTKVGRLHIRAEMIHADLGSVEWPESIEMCLRLADRYFLRMVTVKHSKGIGLLELWKERLVKLKGTGKPFWSSSAARYCTSDMKREPINKHIRSMKANLIISCEGIRAEESSSRAKKEPLTIRAGVTSTYYKGMTVAQALEAYRPDKRLVLTWYPIFDFTTADVWDTEGINAIDLESARRSYQQSGKCPEWWPFHPAYAYGNDRVSCMICVLGSDNDIRIGAEKNPSLANTMLDMEIEGDATFKNGKSLKDILSRH